MNKSQAVTPITHSISKKNHTLESKIPLQSALSDYEKITQAITFIIDQINSQPTLSEISAHLNMSPHHFQRLFCRWAGVTPKRFLQVLTIERAKQLLCESKSILEVSNELGLSSGSRLYDHFVQLEAVSPGEHKNGGKGLTIDYAIQNTPFGKAFVAITARGICQLAFLDQTNINVLVSHLTHQWPHAEIQENDQSTQAIFKKLFNGKKRLNQLLSLHVSGTNFQVKVWQALLQIPPGAVVSYSQVASSMGCPRSARAVGTAIGANPIAFIIPCHRVIQQSGNLGGYHWGTTRKHAIHAWETARAE